MPTLRTAAIVALLATLTACSQPAPTAAPPASASPAAPSSQPTASPPPPPPPPPPVAVPDSPPPPKPPDARTADGKEAAARVRREAVQRQVATEGLLAVLGTGREGEGSIADALGASANGGVGGPGGLGGLGGLGAAGGGGRLNKGPSARPSAPARVGAGAREQWPDLQGIPVPTTRRFLGKVPEGLKTLGDVARFITAALDEHQYEEVGYFRYSDGFAIATRPERIASDAKPVADRRWPAARVRPAGASQSLESLFEVNGEEGERYRSFVFLCQAGGSDVAMNGGGQQTWGLWKTGSANPEGDPLLSQPVSGHKLFAFVYELSQEKGGRVLVSSASLQTAAQHLRAAGLASFLR